MDRRFATTGSYSTVRFGAQVWELRVGSSVTFGRSDDCDIVITSQAQDLLVSRRAGRLTAVDGGLLVSDESARISFFCTGSQVPNSE